MSNININEGEYTCPYCRWNKSHTWTELRPEEKLLDRKVVAENYDSTLYLDTKQKYRVRICRRCSRALKIRDYILAVLIALMTLSFIPGIALLVVNKFVKSNTLETIADYGLGTAIGSLAVAGAFWFIWKIAHRTRVHVTFDDARQCNAIEPFRR